MGVRTAGQMSGILAKIILVAKEIFETGKVPRLHFFYFSIAEILVFLDVELEFPEAL